MPRNAARLHCDSFATVAHRGVGVFGEQMKCSVDQCDRQVRCKGLCAAHYLRHRKWSELRPERPVGIIAGKWNKRWRGGSYRDADGRVLVLAKSHPYPNSHSYVFRYRLVMEQHLGRILRRDEIIHHINGIVDDDRLENLAITDRASHIDIHRPELLRAQYGKNL